jgi:hypothetical protein
MWVAVLRARTPAPEDGSGTHFRNIVVCVRETSSTELYAEMFIDKIHATQNDNILFCIHFLD